ncbi:MAG: GNAT family N-acetyltransferase [Actinomycetota bacterium]
MSVVGQGLAIRPFRPEDESGVVELLNRSLGGGPAGERSSEFFRWKHLANPFGPSFMWVAESEGEVVGLRAFMRWSFKADGQSISAVRAVDTATHPDHQRRGIFSLLTRESLEALREEVALVFNTPNEKSLPGYLKMGWLVVGTIRPSVRLRRPLRFVRHIRALRDGEEPTGPRPPTEAEPAAHALVDGITLSPLLEAAATEHAMLHTPRDLAYLRWRYGDAPLLDYRAIRLEEGGSTTGLALFRVRPRGVLWETAIADLIVRPGDQRTARRLLRAVARRARVDHLTCRFPVGSTAARAARRAGFLPAPAGAPFVVNPLRDGLRPDPIDQASWALSLGDLEVF